ncbi:hypothetical protein CSOJ01_01095 [Colletotrichum sojae]|uniref:Uncharacterized protein n=1 Tax=Colletotrichum sojae TaxID=2175907 RepID=A0A8H6JVT5_9PEZI|nr:hypothetical protein CSOJ01_01095 [Colletotrichum sojae]
MPKVWSEEAERDLLLAALAAYNKDGGNFRFNWGRTREEMARLGYTFTESAMSQRWSKLNKDTKTRAETAETGNPAGPSGAAAPSGTRKRGSRSSSGANSARGNAGGSNQLARQMAADAYAADTGGDDEESDLDVKPPVSKRAKAGGNLVEHLAGRSIDLTVDGKEHDNDVQVVAAGKVAERAKSAGKKKIGKMKFGTLTPGSIMEPPIIPLASTSIKKEAKVEQAGRSQGGAAGFKVDPEADERRRERSVTIGWMPENKNAAITEARTAICQEVYRFAFNLPGAEPQVDDMEVDSKNLHNKVVNNGQTGGPKVGSPKIDNLETGKQVNKDEDDICGSLVFDDFGYDIMDPQTMNFSIMDHGADLAYFCDGVGSDCMDVNSISS